MLQRLNLLAQRRLRNAQQLSGTAKVQLFGNGDEVAQVAQFHTNPIESLNLSNRSNNILERIVSRLYSFAIAARLYAF